MMAKEFKRVMSLFMVLVLCLGMMNLSVLATEGFTPVYPDSEVQIEGESVPVYHVHNSDATVEESLVANRESDPEVYASKTIYPTADENYFEIELKVETSEKITEIKSEPDAAVALSIDYSSSMDDKVNAGICLHCGEGEENAEREETYTDRNGRERTRTVKYHACVEGHSYEEDPTTKMDAAIEAAKDFVREFAATATTGHRWVHLNIFDREATVLTGDGSTSWVDVADAGNLAAVLNLIDGIEIGSGTNVAHGLALASEALDEERVANLQHKYVVVLGDGRPTSSYDAPSGNWAKYSSQSGSSYVNAEKWARKIREGQNANLSSIYVGDGGSGYTWFQSFSAQSVLATNATALVGAFEQHLAFITFGIEAWSVTDPMGDNIEFTGKVSGQNNYSVAGNTLTWNLINDLPEIYDADGYSVSATDMVEGEAYTFIYTFRYGIRLDNDANGFAAETYYNANGNTYLQYYLLDAEGNPIDLNGRTTTSLLKLNFVVPAVQGFLGEFSFVKESPEGDVLSGAQFVLTHDGRSCVVCDGVAVDTLTATSDEDGLVTFSGIPSGHSYTLTEVEAPEGYELSQDTYKVTVSYGEVAISLNGQTVEDGFSFVNEPLPAYGPLTIIKEFAGDEVDAPADLAFVVTDAEGEEVATVPYTDFVDGAYTVENLIEGSYTVTEINAEVEGYTLEVSAGFEVAEIADEYGTEVSFTNTYTRIPGPGSLTITKEFVDVDPDARPTSLVFDVAGPEGYEGETFITLNNDNEWSCTIENVPVGSYTVTEYSASVEGYELISTTYNGEEVGSVEVTEGTESVVTVVNTYKAIEKFGSLHITKTFGEISELHADNWPEGGKLTFTVTSGSDEYTLSLPTADGEWSDGFEKLPLGTYTIAETDNVDGYSFSKHFLVNGEVVTSFELTEDGVDLEAVNTYTKDTVYGPLTITKEFAGDVVDAPANLTFVVTDAHGEEIESIGYASFEDGTYTLEVPAGDYTVTEIGAGVSGYDLSVTANGEAATSVDVTVTENGALAAFVNTYAETQKFGPLTIVKTFSGVSALPAALTFEVRDSSGELVESIAYSAFENGSYTLTDLPTGDYTVTEIGAEVTGYGLTATGNGLVTVTENGGTVTLRNNYSRNTNNIYGSDTITIEKVDEQGNRITATATFGLFQGERRVATARTSDGVATFTFGNVALGAGEYTLKEVTAPRGYLRTEETWPVVVTSDCAEYETVEASVSSWSWNATVNGSDSIKVVNVKDEAKLTFDKSASGTTFAAGDTFEYTLTVANVGSRDASEVVVTDRFPSELRYTGGIQNVRYSDGILTWNAGDLAAGETKTLTFEVTIFRTVPAGTVITNMAYVVWDDDHTNFIKDSVDVTVTAAGTGSLTVAKTYAGVDNLRDDVTFTVTGPEGYATTFTYGEFTDGAYTLINLEPGSYTVTESNAELDGWELAVTANGVSSDAITVDVVSAEVTAVTFHNEYTELPPVEEEPIEIDEPEVPLVDEPPIDEPIEIDEPEVPLIDEPPIDEPIEIDEPEVPLVDVPKTGDPLLTLLGVLGASGAGLTGLVLRKGKDEDEE